MNRLALRTMALAIGGFVMFGLGSRAAELEVGAHPAVVVRHLHEATADGDRGARAEVTRHLRELPLFLR